MTKKIIIVGAGPGGLAAAMTLAHAGLDVTVVERQNYVGGRTSTIHSGGFRFDRGPTFFLYPRILRDIFAATGHDLFEEVEMTRLDPQYRLVFGEGGELNATPDISRMEAEIARLSPQDAGGFTRFMDANRDKMNRFASILERPFDGISDLLKRDTLAALPLLRPWRSLHQESGKYFRDPRLKLAFTFQGKYLGMSPFQCPSLFSILSFLEYEHGVWHPTGGCGAISQAMARLARSMGAKIRLGETVNELLFRGKKVVGLRTNENVYAADAVVVNADFAHAMTNLVPDQIRRKWNNRTIARKKYSCSTYMLYLGIDGKYPELPHHTIYLSKDYQSNLKDIAQGRLSKDPSFYVQNASVTDATLAPSGRSTLYVLVPVPNQTSGIDWKVEAGALRQSVMRQLAKVGVKDVEDKIRVEHSITPDGWEKSGIYRGATFNLAHNLRQMLHMRPHNRFEDLDSVYLVGGGTHPGSGLPTIYSSARITCSALMSDLGVSIPSRERETEDRHLLTSVE